MDHQLVLSATFIIYVALMFSLGLYAYRRTHDASDYYLGGRSLSPWVAALSAGASDMSGWVLIGLPGYAYLAGLEAAWMAIGLCIGVASAWLLVARRLRKYSYALNDAVTLPSYFQRRFATQSPWLRTICAVFILLFFLFYVSSGLMGGGKLFVSFFGLNYSLAVVVGTLAVISYTLFGGFLAVSWTDVVQALLMTLALVIVPVVALTQVDDFSAILASQNPAMLNIMTNRHGEPLSFIAWASLIGWGLAYFGQPHILARFKAVRSESDVPKAATIAIVWSIIVYSLAVLVGMVGAAYIAEPLLDSEKVFMVLVEVIFHPLVAGVLLAAILAAIMSTVDSQLLVCSSALAEDMIDAWSNRDIHSAMALKLGRLAVVGLAIIACLLALDPKSKVLDMVAYAWGGLGAAFGPALLISLYWRRMTAAAAIAGIFVGGTTVLIWAQLQGGWFDLYELVPGFFLSSLTVITVSLLTKKPSDKVQHQFDHVIGGGAP